jgi:DNA polymerase elongation subunit (family B)
MFPVLECFFLLVFRYILEQILSDLEPDERLLRIHEHLERLRVDLEVGRVPLSLLTITKQLTKNPEEYADKKSLPHVQVALRLNEHSGRKLKQGDTVPYIICEVTLQYAMQDVVMSWCVQKYKGQNLHFHNLMYYRPRSS